MEMSNLRAFVVLGDLHNFARTGEQLHLSKPAVFGQIRQLEEEIGEKLYQDRPKEFVAHLAALYSAW